MLTTEGRAGPQVNMGGVVSKVLINTHAMMKCNCCIHVIITHNVHKIDIILCIDISHTSAYMHVVL